MRRPAPKQEEEDSLSPDFLLNEYVLTGKLSNAYRPIVSRYSIVRHLLPLPPNHNLGSRLTEAPQGSLSTKSLKLLTLLRKLC